MYIVELVEVDLERPKNAADNCVKDFDSTCGLLVENSAQVDVVGAGSCQAGLIYPIVNLKDEERQKVEDDEISVSGLAPALLVREPQLSRLRYFSRSQPSNTGPFTLIHDSPHNPSRTLGPVIHHLLPVHL